MVVDGSDNFELRYLINDACVKAEMPWIYGGAVGAEGMARAILPGETPCLRCLHEEPPEPGSIQTCDTAGVLAAATASVASFQALEALKICGGRKDALVRDLVAFDFWRGETRRIGLAGARRRECPCCGLRRFDYLEAEREGVLTTLCGRDAVQVRPPEGTVLSLEALAKKLRAFAQVKHSEYLVRAAVDGYEITVFPDGRAIVKGTDEPLTARSVYAKYVGS